MHRRLLCAVDRIETAVLALRFFLPFPTEAMRDQEAPMFLHG